MSQQPIEQTTEKTERTLQVYMIDENIGCRGTVQPIVAWLQMMIAMKERIIADQAKIKSVEDIDDFDVTFTMNENGILDLEEALKDVNAGIVFAVLEDIMEGMNDEDEEGE